MGLFTSNEFRPGDTVTVCGTGDCTEGLRGTIVRRSSHSNSYVVQIGGVKFTINAGFLY